MGIGRDGKGYRLPVRLRGLATAEVAESPGGVSQHAKLPAIAKQLEERAKGTLLEHKVTTGWAVASDITQRPDGLLANIWLMAAEKLHKDWDGASFDDHLCLFSRAGGDVRQRPSGFKLDKCVG